MTPTEIRSLIQKAADACMTGNSSAFASLFTSDAEIILPGHRLVGKANIEKVTADYLASLEDIRINIQRIAVEGDRSVVEWCWEDKNKATGEGKRAENTIIVEFESGAITRWQEKHPVKPSQKQ